MLMALILIFGPTSCLLELQAGRRVTAVNVDSVTYRYMLVHNNSDASRSFRNVSFGKLREASVALATRI